MKKKKAESDTVDDQHVALADAIASWRHGILTIGTFGFDPRKHFNQLKEIQLLSHENEENCDKNEQFSLVEKYNEEENGDRDPLVQHAAKHGFNNTDDSMTHFNVHDQKPKIMYTGVDHVAADNSNNYKLGIDEKREIEGKRITLADLFSVDCEEYTRAKPMEDHDGHMIKKAEEATISPAAKMQILPPKEDSHSSRPIKKINRLMTKILKRKIHPEGKNEKKGNQMKHSCEIGANERVSLL